MSSDLMRGKGVDIIGIEALIARNPDEAARVIRSVRLHVKEHQRDEEDARELLDALGIGGGL